jgi:hypothetical protein
MARKPSEGFLFLVDESGVIRDGHFKPRKSRHEFYTNLPSDWADSPKDLAYAASDCPPLMSCIHDIYTEAREDYEEELDGLEPQTWAERKRAASLRQRLAGMPVESEGNADIWLEGLDGDEFASRVVPAVSKWFDDPPDMGYEDDYVDDDSTAQGSALVYFRCFNHDELEELGIGIVEGDRPGSNNCYALLEGDIDQANKAAAKLGLRIWFTRDRKRQSL